MVLICKKMPKFLRLSKLTRIVKIVGQVMFPRHSDQLSQKSQVFRVPLCLSKVKFPGLLVGSDRTRDQGTPILAVLDS